MMSKKKNSLSKASKGAKLNANQINHTLGGVQNKVGSAVNKAEAEAFSAIDSAIALLGLISDGFDGLGSTNGIGLDFSFSPLGFLMTLLNKIGVTDEEIKGFLVDFLIDTLPAIEIGVKAALLANIKGLVSCSLDPRIPKKYRQRTGPSVKEALNLQFSSILSNDSGTTKERGILVDCDSIDPQGILSYSPFTDKGKNYYFGVINDEMTLFLKNLGIDSSTSYGTVENTDGSLSVTRNGSVSSMKNRWELCRAIDKNAFLWFAFHIARFPSPFTATINKTFVTVDDEHFIDETDASQSSVLMPMSLNVDTSKGTSASSLSIGSTIMDSRGKQISLCIGADFNDEVYTDPDYTGDTYIVRNHFVPVSSNWNSADWYVDKDEYYNFNLGFKNPNPIADYGKQKAICNIQYLQPTDYRIDDVGGTTQKFRLTILPQPYVYIPYINGGEPIWRWKRILFDAYGNPDSNGYFSLPVDETTSENLPYVHNTSISPFTKTLAVQNELNREGFDNDLLKAYKGIVYGVWNEKNSVPINDVKDGIVNTYSATTINAMYLSMREWDIDSNTSLSDSEKQEENEAKAKCMSVLEECFKNRVAKEGAGANDKYTIFQVGEKDDDCSLYIDKDTGDYFLASTKSPSVRDGDYTKHLVRCYNGLTVYEFNYDFVMGMQLFSPKVVCAKLLEAANGTSSFSVGANKTKDQSDYDYFGNKQSVIEIVRKIIESEGTELSDCFFSFDNSDYARMMEEADDKRYHQQPYLNDKNGTIDLTDAYNILNGFSDTATKHEQKKVLSNAISAATAKIGNNSNVYAKEDSSKIRLNFATNMLSQLAAAMIDSILSPKVLLLIAVNKELMGDDGGTFNPKDLLNAVKGLVVAAVKEVVNLIIQKLLDFILDFLGPLAAKLTEKIATEQLNVYMQILSQLLKLLYTAKYTFNNARSEYGMASSALMSFMSGFGNNGGYGKDLATTLDNVNYADIIASTSNNTDKPMSNSNC